MSIDSVLVAIDFSEASRSALAYAVAFAGRVGASVTAMHVLPRQAAYAPFPTFAEPMPPPPDAQERLAAEVRRLVDAAGGQRVEVLVRDGDPADEILATAAGPAFDLVVLGTHGGRGFERWSLGSVTDRVARRTERPLLAVPPHAALPPSVRMLCALDLSDASVEVLEQAGAVAERLGSSLLLLYVADGSHWYDPWPISGVDPAAVRAAVAETEERRLSELAARHVQGGVRAEVRVAFGRPHREIERVASEQADLVVLGVPTSRGIDRLFFGSTAQHVLRAGVCPVLLVRHAPGAGRQPLPD